MNLIPNDIKITGNYFCTWDSQCDEMYFRNKESDYLPARDAMCEEFLFGENGLLNSFDGAREDLIALLDDGWDVPYGARDTRLFGSLTVDTDRFPSLSGLSPADRLKALSEKVRSLGYKGLGLWVPTQPLLLENGKEIEYTPEKERLFWEERARWCSYAGVVYIKADWGKYQGDADFCRMMTECFRKFAPEIMIEHGLTDRPLFESEPAGHAAPQSMRDYLAKVLPACDYLRTYDVVHEIKYASTVDRAAICLDAAKNIEGDCAVLNIEDTALIGAALGCSIGVMRHDAEKRRKYVPLPPRLVSESVCALRWQRISPPFAANRGCLHISDERLKDVWHCPSRAKNLWPSLPEGDYYTTAPAAISRNMPLPEVTSDGEKPYVLCSVNPDGNALCIAVTPRTFGEKVDVTPPARITVKGKDISAPVGIFGSFETLTVEWNEPVGERRIYAQHMLSDTAEDITAAVKTDGCSITVPGSLINGLKRKDAPDREIPAAVIKLI